MVLAVLAALDLLLVAQVAFLLPQLMERVVKVLLVRRLCQLRVMLSLVVEPVLVLRQLLSHHHWVDHLYEVVAVVARVVVIQPPRRLLQAVQVVNLALTPLVAAVPSVLMVRHLLLDRLALPETLQVAVVEVAVVVLLSRHQLLARLVAPVVQAAAEVVAVGLA